MILKSVETTTNYSRNIDHVNVQADITYLEQCPPALTYYDFGDQLKQYAYKTFLEKLQEGAAEKDAIAKAGDIQRVEDRISFIREKMKACIGGMPASDMPLNATVKGVEHCCGFRIEKIIFNSRKGVYITGNLYVPESLGNNAEKTGAVLFVCGHAKPAKAFEQYQNVCRMIALGGLIAFAIDPVGQGERVSYYNPETGAEDVEWGCPEHDYVGAQCMLTGDSTARYFVHDGMRAIDYLCSREEVDPGRIGVTGNSGGGTQTSLLMMCDDRIAAAAPGTFISGMRDILESGIVQDSEQIWNGMMQYGIDHDDILLCMAPKPVMVLGVTYDFFPIEGARRSVESAARFWEIYRKRENIELCEDIADHCYTKKLALCSADFFSRHFLGKKFYYPVKETQASGVAAQISESSDRIFNASPYERQAPETLQCTETGQVKKEFADARFIFEENLERYKGAVETSAGRRAYDKERARKWLREKVHYNRRPVALNLRKFAGITVNELTVESLIWWANEGLFNSALCFRQTKFSREAALPVTLAVWDGGTTCLNKRYDFIRAICAKGKRVIVLDVSGCGAMMPNRINTMPMHGFEGTLCAISDTLIWQGDSLPALRAWDVLRAIKMIREELGVAWEDIEIYGEGIEGWYAAIAAFVSDEPLQINFETYPENFANIICKRFYHAYDIMNRIMPGMLRYFDVEDIKKWLKTGCE